MEVWPLQLVRAVPYSPLSDKHTSLGKVGVKNVHKRSPSGGLLDPMADTWPKFGYPSAVLSSKKVALQKLVSWR